MRPRRWQPTRLPHLWDSPSKNTGVGCHFLVQCMKGKSESEVAHCVRLFATDPMDCSPLGSSVHGIFQARVPEWGAIAFSVSASRHLYFHSETNSTKGFSQTMDIHIYLHLPTESTSPLHCYSFLAAKDFSWLILLPVLDRLICFSQ